MDCSYVGQRAGQRAIVALVNGAASPLSVAPAANLFSRMENGFCDLRDIRN